MSSVPDFVTPVHSAVSGRLLWRGTPGTGDPTTPAVLEAHLLPGVIGSSVYVLGAVGPSNTPWPYFPLGGVTVSDHGELTILKMDDDRPYWFARAGVIEPADDGFEPANLTDPEDLIDWVLQVAVGALSLVPWDATLVEDFLDACEGSPYFEQFMALPEAKLPGEG